MLHRHLFILAFGLLTATASQAAGFVHNENFVVFYPPTGDQQESNQLAQQVLDYAEQCRAEIAKEWLGKELPRGLGRTTINIEFTQGRDTAMTWAKDDPARRYHTIYLTTSPDRLFDGTLKHELTHAVLATRWRHPNRLPAWTEEGIASRYDDAPRIATRREIIQWCAETDNWPRLKTLFQEETIAAAKTESYAVAASLTEFLLEKGDKETFFAFAAAGGVTGWDAAVSKHYGMRSVEELQFLWQTWVSKRASGVTVAARL